MLERYMNAVAIYQVVDNKNSSLLWACQLICRGALIAIIGILELVMLHL